MSERPLAGEDALANARAAEEAGDFEEALRLAKDIDDQATSAFYQARAYMYQGDARGACDVLADVPAPWQVDCDAYEAACLLIGVLMAFLGCPGAAQDMLEGELRVGDMLRAEGERDVWRTRLREELGSADEALAELVVAVLPDLPLRSWDSSLEPCFVIGESHSLPIAHHSLASCWRAVPRFIPGLKTWSWNSSLKGSGQREAAALASTLAALPPGASILVVCGEIDTRPYAGIARAVAGGHYTSFEEGARATATAFVGGLVSALNDDVHRRVAVHPIRPPTDAASDEEVARICMLNVAVAASIASADHPRLDVLDVCHRLVGTDGRVDKRLSLPDHVHLRGGGRYIEALGESLATVWPSETRNNQAKTEQNTTSTC